MQYLFETSVMIKFEFVFSLCIMMVIKDSYKISSIKNIFKTIRYGVNAMPQWQNTYSNKQIAQVASYVKSLRGTNPPNPKAPQGELYKEEAAQAAPLADSAGKAYKEPIKDSLKK